KVASSPSRGTMMAAPFGPRTRMRWGFAAWSATCSSARPRSPASPNPGLTMTAARVPRSPSSPIRPGTVSAGEAMIARSATRKARNGRMGDKAFECELMGTDYHDVAGKPGAAQVPSDRRSDGAGLRNCADKRYRPRFEELVEITDRHFALSLG